MKGLEILVASVIAISVFNEVEITGASPSGPSRPCPNGCGYLAICAFPLYKCICKYDFLIGNPDFFCYNPHSRIMCQIFSDPIIQGFNNATSGIKIPAAISLTNHTVENWRVQGRCSFDLGGWGKRFGGKYFVESLQFSVEQTVGETLHKASWRVIAKVTDTDGYIWEVEKKSGQSWNSVTNLTVTSHWFNDEIEGCPMRFIPTETSKFLEVVVSCCRVIFAIRPFDPSNANVVPGVWVLVNKRDADGLIDLPQYLCNNVTNSSRLQDLVTDYGFDDKTQLMTYLGLAYGKPIDYPQAFPLLGALQTKLVDNCAADRRSAFMTKAGFLFNFAKLIRCMGPDIMSLTFKIVHGYCDYDVITCASAISQIKTTCRDIINQNDQLKSFLNNGCF